MKKIVYIVLCLFVISSLAAEDIILTAGAFFQSVSEFYGTITDYEASLDITTGTASMQSNVSFKRPNLLRIDFSNPETQVILFNGSQLTIYLPGSSAVLTQVVSNETDTSAGANLATPQGLTLMNRYYTISYASEQKIVPLDDDPEKVSNPSDEMVVKLLLERKNATEGFKTITLSVNPETKLIRRVEAVTTANENFSFSFTNYALNQRIPDTRFIYDSPSSANTYSNFLFSE